MRILPALLWIKFVIILISLIFKENESFTTKNPCKFRHCLLFLGNEMNEDKAKKEEEEWRILTQAFEMYKEAYGDLKVPLRFVVPSMPPWPDSSWGMNLGQKVSSIRTVGKFIEASEERRNQLTDMGFEMRLRSKTYTKEEDLTEKDGISLQQIYTAIATYRDNFSEDRIPDNFVVPNLTTYPESTRGLPLGKKLSEVKRNIATYSKIDPNLIQKLESLGVLPFNIPSPEPPNISINESRWNRVYLGLKTYKKIYGNLIVPQPFIIPSTEEWPEEVWGLKLGARVNALRSQKVFIKNNPERRELLDEIGFVWSISTSSDTSNKNYAYMDEEDEYDNEFVEEERLSVVEEEEEPYSLPPEFEEMRHIHAQRAIDVGIVEEIRPIDNIKKGHIKVEHAWFNDDFGDSFMFEDVVEALETWKTLKGNFNISEDFEIQNKIKLPAENDDEFELDSLQVENDEEWPEYLEGMKLGSIVKRIREGDLEVKHLPERKEQLDAIGFDWGEESKFLDIPFDKAMCALFAYYMIRGDLFVYDDFVMPNEDPWPEILAGFELGKIITKLRSKQRFLETHYPKKKYMLNMLEFVWFPIDVMEEEGISWEQEHVKYLGHPLARINAPPIEALDEVLPVDHPEAKSKYEFSYDLVRSYYEKELEIKDIGGYLRDRGYMELADEHEAKYGKPILEEDIEEEEYEYVEEEEEEEESEFYEEDDKKVDDDDDDDEIYEEEEEEEED